MNSKVLTILSWLVVLAMFVAAALVWPHAPDTLPVHYGITGEPNRYGGKVEGLLVLPIVALGVLLLLTLLPRIDPRRARYAEFQTVYALATLAIEVFMALLYGVLLLSFFGVAPSPAGFIVVLVGLLLAVLGTMLDRVQPNWFFGIRTPWTLSSERSWTATHRLGRWVFIGIGAMLVLAGVVQTAWLTYVAIAVCVLGLLGLIAYSFVVWREDQRPLTH